MSFNITGMTSVCLPSFFIERKGDQILELNEINYLGFLMHCPGKYCRVQDKEFNFFESNYYIVFGKEGGGGYL